MAFLSDIQLRPLATGGIPGCETLGLALGQGQSPLEVVVLRSAAQPPVTAMRTAWKDRHGGRPAPVLLVAVYGNRAALCGPSGDSPPVLTNVELGQAERLCLTALEEPDRHSALRFLRPALEAIDSPMAGLRNEGLLSTHEIGVWLKDRSDLKHLLFGDRQMRMTKRRCEDFFSDHANFDLVMRTSIQQTLF